jgi:peroxin-10
MTVTDTPTFPTSHLKMSDNVSDNVSDRIAPLSATPSFNYPFASAPDIIRSHQKDAYFQGVLLNHLSGILRRLYGARFLHTYTTEARTFADLLYLGLTTLIGNRTLGEEYCDIVQIEDDTLKLPSISRRAGYILTSILLPYGLNRILPTFRSKLRSKLEANLRRLTRRNQTKSRSFRLQSYFLEHLSAITSPSPIHALTLTIFYFSGSYYELSKRIWGLRYIFTKRLSPSEARVGYEVLGVLLLLQIAVQGYLHLRSTIVGGGAQGREEPVPAGASTNIAGGQAMLEGGVEVSLDPNSYSSNQDLLFEASTPLPSSNLNLENTTHTPVLAEPRYGLSDGKVMTWIKGSSQRKCTLCLEELKDPSATQCGHVFCWSCIGDWVREKPECPLCRRGCLVQHILPLRA